MLACCAVNPAVRTARACRDPTVSYVSGWASAPDIGRALLTMLRTVAGLRDRAPRPWTGSWTEPSVQPVPSGPSAARLRGSRAASAHDARSRASHNPPVVGSSPTRPTSHAAARELRRSGVYVEDFDLASCCTAAFDPCVGGDQGDVKGFGQGDILSVVGGQVGVKALQAGARR